VSFVVKRFALLSRKFFGINFIHIAPDPVLARFSGADEWVFGVVEVFGGVLVPG
jgi:hypothetical protein